jgi:peptidoglycan/LPS O-acetylase OafA/YrhL
MKPPIYLYGLNGIRAMAAVAVVVSHTTVQLDLFNLDSHVFGTQDNGNPKSLDLAGYGVSMFFVLSGFLITYLLAIEKEKGIISITKFYGRRILRIWPLYYAYMLLCFFVYYFFHLEVNTTSVWFYIFYAANIPFIFGNELLFLGHFWSLAVEEQFYMFWPLLNKLNVQKLIKYSISIIFLMIGVKTAFHFLYPNSKIELIIHVTRFHCMIMGGVAALLFKRQNKLFLRISTNNLTQFTCWLCLFMVLINRFHIISFLDNEILSVVTIFIIIGQVTKTSFISLENKLFDFLGKNSYGIYVIHPLVIFLFSKVYLHPSSLETLNYLAVYLGVLLITIFVSYLSYKYFETPFLKLKKQKFTVVKSASSRKELND